MIEKLAETAQKAYEDLSKENIPTDLFWRVLVMRVLSSYRKLYEHHRL